MVTSSSAIFAVSDVEKTLEFYKEVLGFPTIWPWGSPPTFGTASWGSVTIMFKLMPELAAQIEGHQHYVSVLQVDDLYALHQERGAMIVSPIENQPWGRREYVVRDLNGYHRRFGGDPVTATPASQSLPSEIRIEHRLPTQEEYERVAGAGFYQKDPPRDILSRSWNGVVALDGKGKAIGVVRIMLDAPGWYSIWDVAVLPEWQGRHIGGEIMKEAVSLIKKASPGAWVYLFTSKHAFYERFGFNKESVSMLKV